MQIAPLSAAAHDSASSSISAAQLQSTASPPGEAGTVSLSNSGAFGQGRATSQTQKLVENMVADVFSTTIKGKNYSGSIEDSGNEYIGSVPNVPGADASGPSVQFVETSLGSMIDTLV